MPAVICIITILLLCSEIDFAWYQEKLKQKNNLFSANSYLVYTCIFILNIHCQTWWDYMFVLFTSWPLKSCSVRHNMIIYCVQSAMMIDINSRIMFWKTYVDNIMIITSIRIPRVEYYVVFMEISKLLKYDLYNIL